MYKCLSCTDMLLMMSVVPGHAYCAKYAHASKPLNAMFCMWCLCVLPTQTCCCYITVHVAYRVSHTCIMNMQ